MLTKNVTIEQVNDEGVGLAVIATLSAVDHDGDTYAPGAFSWKEGGGQWVAILPAHNRGSVPLGKAWIYEDGDKAYAKFTLNLNTQAGQDWHAALKFDLATGKAVQEWSYGFDVIDADFQMRGENRVRVLKKLNCDEISPVIRGAGIDTGTVSIKAAQMKPAQFKTMIANLQAMTEAVEANPGMLSAIGAKQLGDIHVEIAKLLDAADGGNGEQEAKATELAVGAFHRHLARNHLAKTTT